MRKQVDSFKDGSDAQYLKIQSYAVQYDKIVDVRNALKKGRSGACSKYQDRNYEAPEVEFYSSSKRMIVVWRSFAQSASDEESRCIENIC